ncbi:MAG: Maf family protein [Verrucomicrobiota bacterium]
MSQPSFILASGSPRRRDLLSEAGFSFEVVAPDVEECEDLAVPIRELTSMNAALKADEVADRFPEAVVLGADTLVLLGEKVFSKPTDRAEAAAMLAELNGRTHHVYTAVAIRYHAGDKVSDFSVTTEVTFKILNEAEQAAYHAQIDPMDKAGAYAAQDHGELIIDQIRGSMSNVIGLPMDEVTEELRESFGVSPTTR